MAMMDDAPDVRRLTPHELSRYKLSALVLEAGGCLQIFGDDNDKKLCNTLCGQAKVCRSVTSSEESRAMQEPERRTG